MYIVKMVLSSETIYSQDLFLLYQSCPHDFCGDLSADLFWSDLLPRRADGTVKGPASTFSWLTRKAGGGFKGPRVRGS
jgi:hypothetical protein